MKPVPFHMSFEQALKRGQLSRMESRAYMDWVKTLPCACGCGVPADDPHHPYDVGFGGGATKVPDYWCIPLARRCHDALHADVRAWEEKHGGQMHHALMTMTRAIYEGVL
jgi:hypothetical protein